MDIETMRGKVRDADTAVWRDVVEAFIERAREHGVDKVERDDETLTLTVELPERDLERELALYALFTELSQHLAEPGEAELRVSVSN
jgi:chaperonin cofactor prefoldin